MADSRTSDIITRQADLPVADKDRIVYDEALGIDRKLVAGERVPPDLVDAYNAAKEGKGKTSSRRSGSAKAKPGDDNA